VFSTEREANMKRRLGLAGVFAALVLLLGMPVMSQEQPEAAMVGVSEELRQSVEQLQELVNELIDLLLPVPPEVYDPPVHLSLEVQGHLEEFRDVLNEIVAELFEDVAVAPEADVGERREVMMQLLQRLREANNALIDRLLMELEEAQSPMGD
jgi:hypothetical protein